MAWFSVSPPGGHGSEVKERQASFNYDRETDRGPSERWAFDAIGRYTTWPGLSRPDNNPQSGRSLYLEVVHLTPTQNW